MKKKFLIFGAGLSGIAAAELLSKAGEEFVLYEGNKDVTEDEVRAKSSVLANVPVFVGSLPQEKLEELDIVIISPGVPVDCPEAKKLRQAGLEIWGEIELAYRYAQGKILAITGTNGKTTTTSLLGEIMKASYPDVQVVGNIGLPFTKVASDTGPDTIVVAEVSSFQLETIHKFCPDVSAILNITPDHLDRHHTMIEYERVKENIAKNQSGNQACILNYEDPLLRKFGERLDIPVLFFSSERELQQGVFLKNPKILYRDGTALIEVCDIGELQVIGRHNYEDVMAACGMAIRFGLAIEDIRPSLLRFRGVEHRIEFVEEIGGVRFYNDSKGTNPDAAIKGIQAMQWPTLLIAGGYDKGAEYEEWISAFDGKVKKLVLLGATREKIADTAKRLGFSPEDILVAKDMEEAVLICFDHAKSGDAVLLSPACASWDMFQNYEARGRIFKDAVKKAGKEG